MYKGETIWATQKAMAQLFDCSSDNIGLHLKNIFACLLYTSTRISQANSYGASIETVGMGQIPCYAALKGMPGYDLPNPCLLYTSL